MIDKIDGLGPIRQAQPLKRAAKAGPAGGPAFSNHLSGADDAGAVSSVASAGSISGILGVQEVDDALARASQGKLRAEDILERLDGLRLELLSGDISTDKLLQLSRVVAARRAQIKDPRLTEILDAIDLRAQVELAKYLPSEN